MSIKSKSKISGILVICIFTVIMTGCSLLPKEETVLKPPLSKPDKETYNLYEVKKGTMVKRISGSGVFESDHMKNLEFKTEGKIVSVRVSKGDKVKKGDPLVQLEAEGLEITLKEREKDLLQAQYSLMQAKQANDSHLTTIRSMELDIAQMKVDAARKQFDGKTLVAEMDGTVTFVENMKLGDSVQLNKTYVSIGDLNQLRLAYEVMNSDDAKAVRVGMKGEVTVNQEKLEAEVVQTPSSAPSTENKDLSAKYAKTLYLKLLAKPSAAPSVGEIVRISIVTATKDNVLIVPAAAVNSFLGNDMVKILDGESVREVNVVKGMESSTEVEVSKGLKEGQKLILP